MQGLFASYTCGSVGTKLNTNLLFSSSPEAFVAVIPLGLAAVELVATPDGPMWPLEASSSRLLRLRLEEAAMPPPTPPPPGAPIVALPAAEKMPAAEPRALLVDAGIAIGEREVCGVGQDADLPAGAAPLGSWNILTNTVT